MKIGLEIGLILLLFVAFYQDNKSRSIHIFVFAGIAILSSALFYVSPFEWQIVLSNVVFVIAVILCLVCYISIKELRLVNIFKSHFGLGDLVFLLAITPLFSSKNFVLFFITGLVFSGLVHLINAKKRAGETIPLAGYMSIYLILLKSIDYCVQPNLLLTDLF